MFVTKDIGFGISMLEWYPTLVQLHHVPRLVEDCSNILTMNTKLMLLIVLDFKQAVTTAGAFQG